MDVRPSVTVGPSYVGSERGGPLRFSFHPPSSLRHYCRPLTSWFHSPVSCFSFHPSYKVWLVLVAEASSSSLPHVPKQDHSRPMSEIRRGMETHKGLSWSRPSTPSGSVTKSRVGETRLRNERSQRLGAPTSGMTREF